VDINWGDVSPDSVTMRSINHRRDEPDYTASAIMSIGYSVLDGSGVSVSENAPWPNAVLLASWGPDGSEEELVMSRRRIANTTRLAARQEDDGGITLA
jgi:hypothetical protein